MVMVISPFLPLPAQTLLTIDAATEAGRIPPLIYGAGMEDVNHEIYGGLYDQRVFGESFEEPTVTIVKGFTSYDSPWSVEGEQLRLHTSGHGKIVFWGKSGGNTVAEVDVKIDSPDAISGFIMNVSDAGDGADAFCGYEIGINARKRVLVIGKHKHDWQPVAEVPVEIEPSEWNRLKVAFDGAKATVSLNDKVVYRFDDTDHPLIKGMTGLRSFDGSASFKNLTIDGEAIAFDAEPAGVAGFRQFDQTWSTDGHMITTGSKSHAKLVWLGENLCKGFVEVDLQHEGTNGITGLIFDVSEAGNGPDNFRGYEVGLNAGSRKLVVGKHEHDWQPIAEVEVAFEPSEWNRLRVDFDGDEFHVSVNGTKVYEYKDGSKPLMSGKVGMRTFAGGATFKDFNVNGRIAALA